MANKLIKLDPTKLPMRLRVECRALLLKPAQEGLPVELLVLEAALSACCKGLDQEASDTELHVLPILERLSQKVTRRDLEDIRNHKSTLNRMHVRVSKLKQVHSTPEIRLTGLELDMLDIIPAIGRSLVQKYGNVDCR